MILPPGVGDAGILPLAAVVVVKGAALLLMVTRMTTILRAFRAARASGVDRLSAFEHGLMALGPHATPLARWVRLELELWGLFLWGWFLRPRVPSPATAFTHHKDAGWSAIACVFVTLIVAEGTAVHLWLSHAGYTATVWIALGLHVYGLVWIIGDAQALRVNRTCLLPGPDGAEPILDLRVGIRARARCPISSIAAVRRGTWDSAGPDERLATVSGPANVKIDFERAITFKPMLGATVEIKGLLLQVDDPARFEQTLTAALTAR
jgi:hypothetical protein